MSNPQAMSKAKTDGRRILAWFTPIFGPGENPVEGNKRWDIIWWDEETERWVSRGIGVKRPISWVPLPQPLE